MRPLKFGRRPGSGGALSLAYLQIKFLNPFLSYVKECCGCLLLFALTLGTKPSVSRNVAMACSFFLSIPWAEQNVSANLKSIEKVLSVGFSLSLDSCICVRVCCTDNIWARNWAFIKRSSSS